MDVITDIPFVKPFLAGSFSGLCSTALFQPFDLVKTRLQANTLQPGSVGFISIVGNVVRREKISGLWKGMTPSMARCVPGVGVYFASLHALSSRFRITDPNPLQAVCLGVVARTFSGISLLPFTVIKTRFESGVYHYDSILGALKKIYVSEGARGLYSGLTATLIRDAPFSGIYLMLYTGLKRNIPDGLKEGQFVPVVYFSCGVLSGCMASLITQPADVIKTHIQLYPHQFSRLTVVISHIYETSGALGYFRGLVPRLLRRTLMSAMSWTVYEQCMQRCGLK